MEAKISTPPGIPNKETSEHARAMLDAAVQRFHRATGEFAACITSADASEIHEWLDNAGAVAELKMDLRAAEGLAAYYKHRMRQWKANTVRSIKDATEQRNLLVGANHRIKELTDPDSNFTFHEMEAALCVWESLLETPPPGFEEWRSAAGSVACRIGAYEIGRYCLAVYNDAVKAFDVYVWDALAYDFEVIPAILRTVTFNSEGWHADQSPEGIRLAAHLARRLLEQAEAPQTIGEAIDRAADVAKKRINDLVDPVIALVDMAYGATDAEFPAARNVYVGHPEHALDSAALAQVMSAMNPEQDIRNGILRVPIEALDGGPGPDAVKATLVEEVAKLLRPFTGRLWNRQMREEMVEALAALDIPKPGRVTFKPYPGELPFIAFDVGSRD